MTSAFVLVKGIPELRDDTLKFLEGDQISNIKGDYGVMIQEVYISFGWPDFILLLEGTNVEQLKETIVEIRDKIWNHHGDNIETSTIICTTTKKINERREKWKKLVKS